MYVPYHLIFSSDDLELLGITFFIAGIVGLAALFAGKIPRDRIKWIISVVFTLTGCTLLLLHALISGVK